MQMTTETFTPLQMLERGRTLAMRASDRMVAMLNGAQPINYEGLDALSGAVIAGTNMIDAADVDIPDEK